MPASGGLPEASRSAVADLGECLGHAPCWCDLQTGRRRILLGPDQPGPPRPAGLLRDLFCCVLEFLATLLDVGLALVGLAFGGESLIAGHLSGRLLNLSLGLLTCVL